MKNIKQKIKKYIDKLFDFSFKKSLTLGVIRVLYWVNVIIGGILAALTVRAGFDQSVLLGVLALLFSPVVFGIYLVILRVLLEAVAVFFRISEDVKKITNILEDKSKGSTKRKKVDDYDVKDKNEE